MEKEKTFRKKLWQAGEKFRDHGLRGTLEYYLKMFVFRTTLFYYMKETMPAEVSASLTQIDTMQHHPPPNQVSALPQLTVLPEGFEFSTFCLDDVMAISRIPERANYVVEKYVIDNFNRGDICLGIKHKGKIAAFTWSSLLKCHYKFYPTVMRSYEAYLYDMYVLKAFRGKNLAPVLRYKNYEVLKGLGRDTFYSITERSNIASFKFKQKLGAKVVFLGLGVYVKFFKNIRKAWVLRRYE